MIRVIIADDHAVVRSGLAQLLATAGDIELVGTANDGTEAVAMAVELRPDVVLMDLSMPGLDGVAATAQIAAAVPETRLLVLTSFSDRSRVLDALEAGADGYLLKHAEPEQIIDAVRVVREGGAPLDPKVARVLLTARNQRPAVDLTDREREVILLVAEGLANKQIARRLGITERTVKAHLTSAFGRIGVSDRTQAALWAREHLRDRD